MRYDIRHALRARWRALVGRCPECGRRGFAREIPRWDEDRIAWRFGWVTGRECGCCGAPAP